MILKICGEEYTVKFSTRIYADDDILDKVEGLSKIKNSDGILNVKAILDCTAGLLLSGLQKDTKHTEYHYDIDNPEDKKSKRNLMFDLLDNFIDEGGDVLDLFEQLNEELQNKGFFGNIKKQQEAQKKSKTQSKAKASKTEN